MTGELDFPFELVAAKADTLIEQGAKVYFKFTCQRCGSRQTFDIPNVLYKEGSCEECGAITDLTEHGCNYLIVLTKKSNEPTT
jgi:hypothetical protein